MRYVATLLLIMCSLFAAEGQELSVLSVIGRAERLDEGRWNPLSRREKLSGQDIVRIGEHSALNLLDPAGERVYSFGESAERQVDKMVREASRSALSKFFAYFRQALLRGDTDRASGDATVVYRDAGAETALCAALLGARGSDYALSLALIDVETGMALGADAPVGEEFIFRITNDAAEPLFVNVVAIDSGGDAEACLPLDKGFTMSHLLIPAGCTVDLPEYRFVCCEPRGEQRFVLVACGEPFDLRHVLQMRDEGNLPRLTESMRAGICEKTLIIR